MATATVQLNTRIDPALKAGGDAVLSRNGVGPSDAIRALWKYLAEHQALPTFMQSKAPGAVSDRALAEQGCGLAFSAVGLNASDYVRAGSTADDWAAIRDDMYDAMIADIEEHCR